MPCQFNAFVRIFVFLFRTLDLIQKVFFVILVYTEMQICKMCYDKIMYLIFKHYGMVLKE